MSALSITPRLVGSVSLELTTIAASKFESFVLKDRLLQIQLLVSEGLKMSGILSEKQALYAIGGVLLVRMVRAAPSVVDNLIQRELQTLIASAT